MKLAFPPGECLAQDTSQVVGIHPRSENRACPLDSTHGESTISYVARILVEST